MQTSLCVQSSGRKPFMHMCFPHSLTWQLIYLYNLMTPPDPSYDLSFHLSLISNFFIFYIISLHCRCFFLQVQSLFLCRRTLWPLDDLCSFCAIVYDHSYAVLCHWFKDQQASVSAATLPNVMGTQTVLVTLTHKKYTQTWHEDFHNFPLSHRFPSFDPHWCI